MRETRGMADSSRRRYDPGPFSRRVHAAFRLNNAPGVDAGIKHRPTFPCSF